MLPSNYTSLILYYYLCITIQPVDISFRKKIFSNNKPPTSSQPVLKIIKTLEITQNATTYQQNQSCMSRSSKQFRILRGGVIYA